MAYLELALGIAALVVCGDLLVRGSVALATRLDIPIMVIGLTIVAFGTSAPELVVSLRAVLTGAPGLAIGNVVGSNIANVLLVLGLPALISATNCQQPLIKRNIFFVIFASLLFIALCFYGPLSFIHGAILFAFMILFIIAAGRRAAMFEDEAAVLTEEACEIAEGNAGTADSNLIIGLFIAAGLIGLPLGAHLTVSGSTTLAQAYGVSDAVIGLTLVAFGTSLPELATTISAALRGQCGLALGNVLGSNLFNILAVMGLTAMASPVPMPVPDVFLRLDLWVMLGATLAITPFLLKGALFTRGPAFVFVLSYVAYIYYAFLPRMADASTLAQM